MKEFEWEKKFEEEFKNLLKNKSQNELKIIIGQKPYKQSLNNIEFKVANESCPYDKLGKEVAFLVKDWIKIQDSLEMIFNLLFNGSINSLKVLAYLRENSIKAHEFADYLYRKYRIILTNINISNNINNYNNIQSLINRFQTTYLLLIGKHASAAKRMTNILDFVEFIHPSGNNLNNTTCQQKYYTNWYQLRDTLNQKQSTINKFILFN